MPNSILWNSSVTCSGQAEYRTNLFPRGDKLVWFPSSTKELEKLSQRIVIDWLEYGTVTRYVEDNSNNLPLGFLSMIFYVIAFGCIGFIIVNQSVPILTKAGII